jgi:hypothetical protein
VHRDEVGPALAHGAALRVAAQDQAHVQVVAPLVRDDRVVDGAVAVDAAVAARAGHVGRDRAGGDGRRDAVAVGQRDAEGRDGDRAVVAAHGRQRVRDVDVVDDQDPGGAGGLGVQRLLHEPAEAAAQERDPPGRHGERLAAVLERAAARGGHAVVDQLEVAAGRDQGVDAEAGALRQVDAGQIGRRGDLERGLADRRDRAVEDVHLHARRQPVGRRAHVGVVALDAAGVLRLGQERVVLLAAAAVVGDLGVAGRLVEAGVVPPVVQPVGHEELLRDGAAGLAGGAQRGVGEAVGVAEHAGRVLRRDDVAGREAVLAVVVGVGADVVALAQVGGAVRQPRIGRAVRVGVEAVDLDQDAVVEADHRDLGVHVTGRVRGQVALRAVERAEALLGAVDPDAVAARLGEGAVAALQDAPVVGRDHVLVGAAGARPAGRHLERDRVGRHERLRHRVEDLAHQGRLRQVEAGAGRAGEARGARLVVGRDLEQRRGGHRRAGHVGDGAGERAAPVERAAPGLRRGRAQVAGHRDQAEPPVEQEAHARVVHVAAGDALAQLDDLAVAARGPVHRRHLGGGHRRAVELVDRAVLIEIGDGGLVGGRQRALAGRDGGRAARRDQERGHRAARIDRRDHAGRLPAEALLHGGDRRARAHRRRDRRRGQVRAVRGHLGQVGAGGDRRGEGGRRAFDRLRAPLCVSLCGGVRRVTPARALAPDSSQDQARYGQQIDVCSHQLGSSAQQTIPGRRPA